MIRTSCVAAVTLLAVSLTACTTPSKHYGAEMRLADKDAMSVADVLTAEQDFNGKYVRVAGTVDSVCAMKGCWIRLTGPDAPDTLFVKFTCPVDDERLIPMEAVGHTATVEGTLEVSEISEAEARHYAQDAGRSAEEIAAISGPQKQVKLAAPAAKIEGLD